MLALFELTLFKFLDQAFDKPLTAFSIFDSSTSSIFTSALTEVVFILILVDNTSIDNYAYCTSTINSKAVDRSV